MTRTKDEIDSYLLRNRNETIPAQAAALQVATSTISTYRAKLIKDGRLKPYAQSVGRAPRIKDPEKRAKAIIDSVLDGSAQAVPAEQRQLILDQMILHGTNEQKMKAIEKRDAQDKAAGATTELGAGDPLTEEEWIWHVSQLLEASGPTRSAVAWRQAFKEEPPNGRAIPIHPGSGADDSLDSRTAIPGVSLPEPEHSPTDGANPNPGSEPPSGVPAADPSSA